MCIRDRDMVAAFLRNRLMRVKVGEHYSNPRLVPGGAPQGSVLGSFLFCVATDALGTNLAAGVRSTHADTTANFADNGIEQVSSPENG